MRKIFLFFCLSIQVFGNHFRYQILHEAAVLPGWCSQEKAALIIDLIHEYHCELCVEIGVFAGASLLPFARALECQGAGIVYGIDPWTLEEASRGYKKDDPNYLSCIQLDYPYYYHEVVRRFGNTNLKNYCNIFRLPSLDAAQFFTKESIDFIHFDGNATFDLAFQDVKTYFPKIKDQGFILFSNANGFSKRKALVFLMERCDLITPFQRSQEFLLFRKNHKRIEKAQKLFKES